MLDLLSFSAFDHSGSRVWLRERQTLHWVSHHLWRAHRVVSLSLKLQTVAQVNLHVLLLLSEESASTWPGVTLHNYTTETLLAHRRVRSLVLGHVAVTSNAPGSSVTLYFCVLYNWFQSWLRGIHSLSLGCEFFWLHTFRGLLINQGDAATFQN